MHATSAPSRLRLVNGDDAAPQRPLSARITRRPGQLPRLTPAQPVRSDSDHQAFARTVALSLEHGRAAVLTPERRKRLMRLADELRIHPFDAALVIALVQDRARRGMVANEAPLGGDGSIDLSPVGSMASAMRSEGRAAGRVRSLAIVAAGLGVGFALILVNWIAA
ncbi:MAG: hypothetical protein KF768_09560 [Phycisphaeraceae bacterium]|nr:hypothetical protein [Phycisphaeraceae bacterium]